MCVQVSARGGLGGCCPLELDLQADKLYDGGVVTKLRSSRRASSTLNSGATSPAQSEYYYVLTISSFLKNEGA